jgi:hypothetical protein
MYNDHQKKQPVHIRQEEQSTNLYSLGLPLNHVGVGREEASSTTATLLFPGVMVIPGYCITLCDLEEEDWCD